MKGGEGWEEHEGRKLDLEIEKQQFSHYSSGVEVDLWNATDDG